MASRDRRAREKARLHNRILDAAQDLFTRHGYEAVTMRRIAEKVEYTPTALYFHFENKEALLQELSERSALALGVEFAKLRSVKDPLERMRRMGKAYIQFALAHPYEYRLLFMTPHPAQPSQPSAVARGKLSGDAYAVLVQTIAEAIAAGLLRPEFRDAEQMAQVFWSGVHGFVSLILVRRNDPWINWRPVAPTGRLVVETLVAGLIGPARPANTISPPKGTDSR
jgi:AcrR family transcriptional regulator